MKFFIRLFLFSLLLIPTQAYNQTASLLPNAVQQFFDNNGNPLSVGTVDTYVAGTSTRKTTWKNSGETISNTNPIVLDAGGKAIIYGEGTYRQVVKDRNGNLIWDAVTTPATGGGGGSGTATTLPVGWVSAWSGITAPTLYQFAYGQEIIRASFPALFTALTITQNVNCTNTSTTVTGLTDTTQIPIGAIVELSCVAPGTTVASKTASTVTLSNPSNVSLSASATFFLYGNGNGSTTFNLPDLRGQVIAGRNNMGGTASSSLTTAYYGTSPDGTGARGGAQSKILISSNLPAYTPAGTIVTTSGFTGNSATPTGTIGAITPAGSISINDPGHQTTGLQTANAYGAGANPGLQAGGPGHLGPDSTGITAGFTGTPVTPIFTGNSATPTGSVASSSAFTGTAQGGTSTAFSIVQPTITLNYIIKVLPGPDAIITSGVDSIQGMVGVLVCGTTMTCSSQSLNVNAASFETINLVTAPPFSAACDGVTNDKVAITAAIAAAVINKAPVVFPSGTCVSGPLVVPSGVVLKGLGKNSILKAHSSVTGHEFIINENIFVYADQDIVIRDMTIDGSNIGAGGSQTITNALISMNHVTHFFMQNVLVKNYQYRGFETTSALGGGIWDSEFTTLGYAGTTTEAGPAISISNGNNTDFSFGFTIQRNNIHDNRWAGIYNNGIGTIIDSNIIVTNEEAGIFQAYSPPFIISRFGVLTNNFIDGVTKHYISGSCIEIGSHDDIISNNQLTNCGHSGVSLTNSQNVVVNGNVISNVNQQGDGAQAGGITVLSSAASPNQPQNLTITNNRVFDDQTIVTSYAGIAYGYSSGGVTPTINNLIASNSLNGTTFVSGSYIYQGTAGVIGTGSIIRSNTPTSVNDALPVAEGGTNCSVASGTCLDNITGFSSTGMLARTAAGTYAFRTLTGTSAEITVTNGSGVSGNPTLSLPTALTFTGKTITGGTFASPAFSGTVTGNNTIPLTILAQSAANTMLGNWTGSTANVLANTMPSCPDTGANRLNYLNGTGVVCGTGTAGTVTSIATTSPITGGTITATGTIACATCVTSAAALTANQLVIGAGLQASAVTTTGTGVLTALGVNIGSAGAPVVFNGAGGTPSSMVLTNATGLPTAGLVNSAVTYAKFQNIAGLSIPGRSASSSGVGADITGTTDQILRIDGAGTSLGFGSVDLSKSAAVGSSILATDNGGTGSTSGAWTSYTPSVSSTIGTITTVGTVSGSYRQIGKLTCFSADVTITTNGSGAGRLSIGIPAAAAGFAVIPGMVNATGVATMGFANFVSSSAISSTKYDGTYPASDGSRHFIGGCYEAS